MTSLSINGKSGFAPLLVSNFVSYRKSTIVLSLIGAVGIQSSGHDFG